jgi:hypothetical protein
MIMFVWILCPFGKVMTNISLSSFPRLNKEQYKVLAYITHYSHLFYLSERRNFLKENHQRRLISSGF